jgi:hypothetical protein
MFVQINPDVSSYAESLSTLRFAERVSGVELGAAKMNKEGKDIREFKEQVNNLCPLFANYSIFDTMAAEMYNQPLSITYILIYFMW